MTRNARAGPNPPNFIPSDWSGSAPTSINNAITPVAADLDGHTIQHIGYEAYVDFGTTSYRFHAFTPSTLTSRASNENEAEISAVAEALPGIPEPTTWSLLLAGVATFAVAARARRR